MKTILKTKVKPKGRSLQPKPTPGTGVKIKIWREYVATFNQKPSPAELSQKKRLFRKSIMDFLLKKSNGKKFGIKVTWKKDGVKPLVYHITVFIWQKNSPPGQAITTPHPPPPAPPAL